MKYFAIILAALIAAGCSNICDLQVQKKSLTIVSEIQLDSLVVNSIILDEPTISRSYSFEMEEIADVYIYGDEVNINYIGIAAHENKNMYLTITANNSWYVSGDHGIIYTGQYHTTGTGIIN